MIDLFRPARGRRWLLAAASLALVAIIACGAEPDGGVASAADDGPAAPGGASNSDASAAGPSSLAEDSASGGIDQACVQRVLGRQASGFGDVTAAERDRILGECSGDGADGAGTGQRRAAGAPGGFQFGGGALAALDPECVQSITGNSEVDITQMTAEQRQSIFQECGSGDVGTDGFGGGFFGRDGLAGRLPDCATEALGRSPDDLQGLTPEDFQAITEACGDELGGFGGDSGFGGGGFFGRGEGTGGFGGGFFGQDGAGQLSECATDVLGVGSADLQSLTPEDFQAITEACGDQFGGFGGFGGGRRGTGGFFGQGGGQ